MSYNKLPSLPALRAFECVARKNSFKIASEEMCVTPGALSQLVKKLENELATQLLIRNKRGLELTANGLFLSQRLEQTFTTLVQTIEHLNNNNQTTVRIASSSSFLAKWLMPRIQYFLDNHTDIDLHFTRCEKSQELHSADADLFIDLIPPGTAITPPLATMNEHYVIAASRGFIARQKIKILKDISGKTLICLIEGNTKFPEYPLWSEVFEQLKLPFSDRGREISFGNHMEQAIDAAIEGLGLIILPVVLASEDLIKKRLIPLFTTDFTKKTTAIYQLTCPPQDFKSDNVNKVRDWITQEITSIDTSELTTMTQSSMNS